MVKRIDNFSFFEKLIFFIFKPFLSDYWFAIFYLKRRDKKNSNLKKPTTFNEKLRWLSIYCRNPIYPIYADKLAVKEILKGKIKKSYIPKLYGFWSDPKKIDWEVLPEKFVLKANHASGCNIIVKNKSLINKKKVINQLFEFINLDYYRLGREWIYKDIPRRIIAEEYLIDNNGVSPKDYKFFCFNGKPLYIQVDVDREIDHKRAFYDTKWNLVPLKLEYPKPTNLIERPDKLDEMIALASKLSHKIPFVRVDLYSLPEIKFGELTFMPDSAIGRFSPSKWNEIFGNLIDLESY